MKPSLLEDEMLSQGQGAEAWQFRKAEQQNPSSMISFFLGAQNQTKTGTGRAKLSTPYNDHRRPEEQEGKSEPQAGGVA